ncbi:MAG: helix-turn-helix domain-containing protein [Oscillospiraceae bacterium]
MKPSNTSERIKQIMSERGLRQADIVTAAQPFCKKYGVNLGKNTLSQYVSGKTEPGQEKLTVLGMALNVSEAWLMGYDVPVGRNTKPATETGDGLEAEIIRLFDELPPEKRQAATEYLRFLAGRADK